MTRLTAHLRRLEAEGIHIIREVAASFRNPVLLYSIGKDSSVVLHLMMKAFAPGKPPFRLLHIATGWDFRAMLEFRDRRAAELGLDLLVHTNPDGIARGINPIASGPQLHAQVNSTEALKQALDLYRVDAALGGALIMVDDERMPLEPGEVPEIRMVRFRTMGCWPLTAAMESEATTVEQVIAELRASRQSERAGRLIDGEGDGSMESKKREGYF